ncbi:diguanylate cyclase (GGDEF)-like protein [Bosea sp. BE125]|uniref:sensor domain-containing diguanylate cyclase n=1 Tax=Bosea sp. BE125 TaxID=2817909 RepID=UPI0028606260|nr:sensor domain-containing diguanylate cyclase [Bosea sp. BE125]MDR6872462.1 diguanylate cyclase (GGDEF)-like protein [Bosea sp. BE125]
MAAPVLDASREQNRLDVLARYDVLDTPNEETFDRVTRLVRRTLNVSMATVTFLDGHRQWFKSRTGVTECEGDRQSALCNLTIRQPTPLVVQDARSDPRFANNPLVVGAPHLRFYLGVPLSVDGQNIGTLCAMDTVPRQVDAEDIVTLKDLAQIVMNEMELRHVAATDSLTGARSRRSFRDEATRILALAARHRHEAGCITFDLDHFKGINDRYGHAIGDAVLGGSVEVCRKLLRQTDLLGRLGGEEFAILLPHTDKAATMNVAEKLREGIASQQFEGVDAAFNVTASFGVASFGPAFADVDAILKAADEALYAAKATGRNRCVVSQNAESASWSLGRRVLKAGQIVFNGGRSVINCTVRRLSEHGANLAVLSTAGVPDRFKLAIEVDSFSRACQIARKADSEIDVQFA